MKRILVNICLILLAFSGLCDAKQIYSTNNRICITVPDSWYYTICPETTGAQGVFAVAANRDTGISLYQGDDRVPYARLGEMSTSDKSIWRDNMIKVFEMGMKQKGYTVVVNKTNITDTSIIIGLTCSKDNIEYPCLMLASIKNGFTYILSCYCTKDRAQETIEVFKTLQIDGCLYLDWLKNG